MALETAHDMGLQKAPTGIHGLDDITFGGLPRGRPTLLVGGAGSGKTLLAMEFLVRGATEFDEPGVFMAFEETPGELATNFATRGFDLRELEAEGKIALDYVYVERSEIEETGEYDLEGLFIRLGYAIDSIGAKRVVLDTIEVLFSGLSNTAILRAELRRLFRWLKEKGVTAIITGERGEESLTRHGLEEYVADCVIILDHRITGQVSTRRLRVLKYRGSAHGTNEYPFLIESTGISVLPITSVGLEHVASKERVSAGVSGLDAMLDGEGYYRATSILVSGTAGTGKSTLAASFVDAASRRGEKSLYFAFEESQNQIIRNMRSVGIDLEPWVEKGLLTFYASRPTQYGLETHLAAMTKKINDVQPSVVVIDPISNLSMVGDTTEVKAMLMRLIDFLKLHGITAMFTNLTGGEERSETRDMGISTLMDTWISIRNMEMAGERNRGVYVLKSRGMAHSNQVREFVLTNEGIKLVDVYLSSDGVLIGTARELGQAREKAQILASEEAMQSKQRELDRKREALEARISAMRAEFEAEDAKARSVMVQQQARETKTAEDRTTMEMFRGSTDEEGADGGG